MSNPSIPVAASASRRAPLLLLLLVSFVASAHGAPARLHPAIAPLPQQQSSFQKGLLALQQNRLDDALSQLTDAESAQPSDASIRNFRAIVLAQLGRAPEAEAEYRNAIRLDPRYEASYRNLGFLQWNAHRLDLAALTLQQALQLDANDRFARFYLGRVQLEQQLYPAATSNLQRSGIPFPDDPQLLLLVLKAHLALGNRTEAAAAAQRLQSLPLSALQTSHLAHLLVPDQPQASTRLLQHWTSAHPGEADPWAAFDLALASLLTANYQLAAEQAHSLQAQAATRGGTPSPSQAADAWSLLGIAHAHRSAPDLAVDAFRRAVQLVPTREDDWLNLTRELMELNRFTDAISATQQAIAVLPRSYALHLRLAAANLAIDRFSDAEQIFRTLIAAGDPLPTSSVGLAQVLLRTGHADQAAAELASARQRLGPSFILSYFQGLASNRAGKPAEAASFFREALHDNPENAEAHSELGKTELKSGHVEQAIAEMQRALQLNPSDQQSRRLLKLAYGRSGTRDLPPEPAEADPGPSRALADPAGDFIVPPWQDPVQ